MPYINIILQLNALNSLLFGALFVFLPQHIIAFLSNTDPAPTVALLTLGVGLNLYGLLLLWVGKRQKPNKKLVKLIAISDFIWVLMTAALILSKTWVTTINGVTVAGLVAILVGWFGVQQWQYANRAGE